jgi:hypothetical protein
MASTYLTKTFSSGDRQKFTFSFWFKTAGTGCYFMHSGNSSTSPEGGIEFSPTNGIRLWDTIGYDVGIINYLRDVNGWYHCVIAFDSTQATSTDRIKFYLNGTQATINPSYSTYPSLNAQGSWNNNVLHTLGSYYNGTGSHFSGSMAHFHFIDGTAYDASDFGETDATTGIWKPKTAPSVTYGTNGFFLKFENSGSMGLDSSPNANNFTVNGSLTQTVDTPSNVFCVNNVLSLSASGVTNANGNLSVTDNASNAWRDLFGTLGVSAGKWYWEQKIDNFATGIDPHRIGICDAEYFNNSATGSNFEDAGISRVYGYCKTGQKINAGSITSYGDSWTTGDIIGIAMDLDNGKIYFSKNGTWQNSGDPTSGATGTGSAFNVTTNYTYLPSTSTYYTDNRYSYNFGNGYFGTTAVASAGSNGNGAIFEYDVPTGYYALNTKNINTYG